jgi:hypothetical protein
MSGLEGNYIIRSKRQMRALAAPDMNCGQIPQVNRPFEGLELCERKLSCTVLRGLDGSNPVRLLGDPADFQCAQPADSVLTRPRHPAL